MRDREPEQGVPVSAAGQARMKVAAVLPAYNEEGRVASVVRAVKRCSSVSEVIVVNDGSTDNTAEVVLGISGVTLLSLPRNRGKGGAMVAGAHATEADVVVFLDADLIGLRPDHVEALIEPVLSGDAQMCVGQFKGGRRLTDWSQRIAPSISGQRAIVRDVFLDVPGVSTARYGVEMLITRFCRCNRIPTDTVVLAGVTHPMKEEKMGLIRGWTSRGRMFYQILRTMVNVQSPRRPYSGGLRSTGSYSAGSRARSRHARREDKRSRRGG